MKNIAFILAILFCISIVFVGCSSDNKSNDSKSSSAEVVSELPKNKYTNEISEPKGGEIVSVSDNSDEGSYSVTYKISEKDKDNYIKDLEKQGYKSMSTNTSVLTMLTKNNVTLNIAYSEGVMSILILM